MILIAYCPYIRYNGNRIQITKTGRIVMTVLDLIEIMELNKENDIFIPLPSGPYFVSHYNFEISSKKIIFYEELTLPEFYDSQKNISCDLIKFIQDNVVSKYDNKREFLRYFSVFQLLIAIDQVSGNDNCVSYDKYLEIAKQYVEKINQAIEENYQTDSIKDMKDLMYILFNSSLYHELYFHIQVFDYNKNRPRPNKNKDFSFGNKRFHNGLDIVHITIYNDYVELWHPIEGRSHERELSLNNTLSLEQKIIAALDCWQTYFNN